MEDEYIDDLASLHSGLPPNAATPSPSIPGKTGGRINFGLNESVVRVQVLDKVNLLSMESMAPQCQIGQEPSAVELRAQLQLG